MQLVAESIDDKSQKLFNIIDQLASLTEQARKMQYEINQLNNDQAESMSELLLLCEHLGHLSKTEYHSKREY
ncbi:hypothetical protein H5410_047546 [Solanum commersonii]|uniref:Uncharacterized protein n=1 Tax=Solanum commersonii TaxID=4109 RepID=A0A9J5XJF1_SOLCO|nr:hypothetical protein H5410_047546 [Solanum commersonii]